MKGRMRKILALLLSLTVAMPSTAAIQAAEFCDGESWTEAVVETVEEDFRTDDAGDAETELFGDGEEAVLEADDNQEAPEESWFEDEELPLADDTAVVFEDEEQLLAADTEVVWADGTYKPDNFSFSGGTGKTQITCESIEVKDGQTYADIKFSSSSYTKLVVDGQEYAPVSNEGGSLFHVLIALNEDVVITGNTVAMGTPHDVNYTVHITLSASAVPEPTVTPDPTEPTVTPDPTEPTVTPEPTTAPDQAHLEDGTYTVSVSTDSSMFAVNRCKVLVKDGQMYAVMTLKGDGFDRMYMGSETDAANAAESDLIAFIPSPEESYKGQYMFWPVPINDLTKSFEVSGRSRKKGTWYQHTMKADVATLKKISDEVEVPTQQMEAQKYLRQFYTDGNIFKQYTDVITKSGQTYSIPFYTASKTTLKNLKLNRPDTSLFQSGWYLPTDRPDVRLWFTSKTLTNYTPAKVMTYQLANGRPKDPLTFDITLKLFPGEGDGTVTVDDINNGTAEPLAEQTFTLVLEPKPLENTITFEVINSKTQEAIEGAEIVVADEFGNAAAPSADGTYTLLGDRNYTVTASKEGYVAAGGARSYTKTFRPSGSQTIQLPLLTEEEAKDTITFQVLNENNEVLPNAKITVKDSGSALVDPQEDGTYLLWDGIKYSYTVEADGYQTASVYSFTPTKTDMIIVNMIPEVREYSLKFKISTTEKEIPIEDPVISLTYEEEGETKNVEANEDGIYTVYRDVTYTCVVSAKNFKTITRTISPTGNNAELTEYYYMDVTGRITLERRITAVETEYADITEGEGPGQYPEGTITAISEAVNTAKSAAENMDLSEEEYEKALKEFNSTIAAIRRTQKTEEGTITFRYQRTASSPAEQVTLKVDGTYARKYKIDKPASMLRKLTVGDALAALHVYLYGDDYAAAPTEYLNEAIGYLLRVFNENAGLYYFRVNNEYSENCETTTLKDGDVLSIFKCTNSTGRDEYMYFENSSLTVEKDKEFTLTLLGTIAAGRDVHPEEGYTVTLENKETGDILECTAPADKDGVLKYTASVNGVYIVKSVEKEGSTVGVVYPFAEVTVKDHEHTPGEWNTDENSHWKECTACGEKVEEGAHSYELTSGKPATCTEAGTKLYTCTVCKKTKTETTKAAGHKWSEWKTVSKATLYKKEVQERICSVCKEKETREVGSPVKLTASLVSSYSNQLNAKAIASLSGSSLKVTWGKVSEAQGYEVYAGYCGQNLKLVKTIKNADTTSYKIKKLGGKSLKASKNYKVRVRAYTVIEGKKRYIANGLTLHVAAKKSAKYTDAKKVKLTKNTYTLKKGRTEKLSASVTKISGKKSFLTTNHAARLRYWSTNTKVASVSASGKIKAVGKGTCYIYVMAQNGVKTRAKITVK